MRPVKEIMQKNKSPFEKEKQIHDDVLKFVQQNLKGMTTTEIQKKTGVSRKTLEKHLSLLVFENEIHMNQYGPTRVYYPNRKVENFKTAKIELGNRTYFFDLLQNQWGRFYLIQEKKKDNNKLQTKGSIIIPEKNIKNFIDGIKNIGKK